MAPKGWREHAAPKPGLRKAQVKTEIISMTRFLLVIVLLPAFGFAQTVEVKAEESVYKFVNPNNGSGPLWDYGSTNIVRSRDDVYLSQQETGEGVPPLSNTRWRLLKRTAEGWKTVAEQEKFIQREPCPMGVMDGTVFMSINPSTQPPGTKYGNCVPQILKFTFADGQVQQTVFMPVWNKEHNYTDHSYRGFAVDAQARKMLLLNIDAKTSEQSACLISADGETLGGASVSFPIRACYPQVALCGNAVHVMAVGDIVEPVEEWKQYKFDQTKATWDYVFRILYYTCASDITKGGFNAPIEIANVDKTAGAISNQDLWLSPEGEAYLMYTEREVASLLLRDKFFPGKSLVGSLHLAVVKDGAVASRKVLHAGTESEQCGHARFHVATDGTVYAVLYVSGAAAGNKLMQIYPPLDNAPLIPIPVKQPVSGYCLACVRAGNAPSNTIDMLAQSSGDTMSYVQAVITQGR
jgi:hypothetical protein